MKFTFYKYHGTGNDFILIDDRSGSNTPENRQVAYLCDRHTGIGADGLMILHTDPQYPFRMRYYNADGLESTMCGNGGRCVAAFAKMLGLCNDAVEFSAADGVHHARILASEGRTSRVSMSMHDVTDIKKFADGTFLNTGSPHFLRFIQNVRNLDILMEGSRFRHDPRFGPGGTNVSFAEMVNGRLFMRTFERGVENETLSCGTGVIATAIAAVYEDLIYSKPATRAQVTVSTPGGELTVSFLRSETRFTEILLEGEVRFVFKGEIEA